jgi:hypothetical protein
MTSRGVTWNSGYDSMTGYVICPVCGDHFARQEDFFDHLLLLHVAFDISSFEKEVAVKEPLYVGKLRPWEFWSRFCDKRSNGVRLPSNQQIVMALLPHRRQS